MVLVDSGVFIELERQAQPWRQVIGRDVGEELLAVATITASELLNGMYRADTPQRRAQRETYVEDILGSVAVLPFDLASARVHAEIWADLLVAGQMIGRNDSLIAATALAHEGSILTRN